MERPYSSLVFACPEVAEEYDYVLAAENIMLTAHSVGIGSCWIGLAKQHEERYRK